MDPSRFDALIRSLGHPASRRGIVAGLVSGLVAAALELRSADARKDKRNRRRGEGSGAKERHGGQRGRASDRARHKRKPRTRDADRLPSQAKAVCFGGSPCVVGPSAYLAMCDLSNSTLLQGAVCTSCNLSGANLNGANASGANLRSANLGNACLVDADLSGANFGSVNTRGAIFCRTTMPNGTINNSGCSKRTRCCPTCQEIGGPCGGPLGGGCCGGARCIQGVCACPADKPVDCGGVCKGCCDDGGCGGDTPRCCDGVCRGCCANGDCSSGICCANTCCAGNEICDRRLNPAVCCDPESRDQTCLIGAPNQKCGVVDNNCGQPVSCPPCPPRTCQSESCDGQNACAYTPDANNSPGTDCPTPRVCCTGAASVCCATDEVCDTRPANPVCCLPQSDSVTCGIGTPAPKCGTVTNNCGLEVNCGSCPAQTCRSAVCLETSTCDYPNSANNQSGVGCDAPRVCCNGGCCGTGQFCDTSQNPPACANCNCEYEICKIGICAPQTPSICTYINVPNGQSDEECQEERAFCCEGDCCPGNWACAVPAGGNAPECCAPQGARCFASFECCSRSCSLSPSFSCN